MKKLWFKAKRYGWGWYPSSWQGWLVLLLFIGIVFANQQRLDLAHASTERPSLEFLIETSLLIVLLVWICYRTGEKPRWRWGK